MRGLRGALRLPQRDAPDRRRLLFCRKRQSVAAFVTVNVGGRVVAWIAFCAQDGAFTSRASELSLRMGLMRVS